ncbi:hypothetical protein Bca101_056683 [Brassica carinata]
MRGEERRGEERRGEERTWRFLTWKWLTLFIHAHLFGPPINPYSIPPDIEGLWRVDNPKNFDNNLWSHGSLPNDIVAGEFYFHAKLAVGFFNYNGDLIYDIDFEGVMITLK